MRSILTAVRDVPKRVDDAIMFYPFATLILLISVVMVAPFILSDLPTVPEGVHLTAFTPVIRVLWIGQTLTGIILLAHGIVAKDIDTESGGMFLLGLSCIFFAIGLMLRDRPWTSEWQSIVLYTGDGLAALIRAGLLFRTKGYIHDLVVEIKQHRKGG